jgi:hypothetical protein
MYGQLFTLEINMMELIFYILIPSLLIVLVIWVVLCDESLYVIISRYAFTNHAMIHVLRPSAIKKIYEFAIAGVIGSSTFALFIPAFRPDNITNGTLIFYIISAIIGLEITERLDNEKE